MDFGICELSVIPLRSETSHKSEIVSQLLFGETYQVLEKKPEWLRIRTTYDDYEGWMERKQFEPISAGQYKKLANNKQPVALEVASAASSAKRKVPILIGSTLPDFDGMNFKIDDEQFVYNGQAIMPDASYDYDKIIEKCALKFLHAPYLWGGRSPFGIDCSGFTQVVFKLLGVALKRDAYQQAMQGRDVDFIDLAKEGDLAFFENKEGKITHVGIILKDKRLIHASGKVRIDRVDSFGIYNEETKKYSHNLKVVKRVL
ncbi:MAG: C40 family peptidase [Chitinophagales bacterium]|nr:C40 family peptidase [Chitinophagales bacterium]